MTLSHSNIYQTLECFGNGLWIVTGCVIAFLILLRFLRKYERPVEAWFLCHPKSSKGIVIGGWSLMSSVVVFFVFEVGCYFGGGR